jgi:iron-sulfur cluster repair protein YtfE (RIC family)
MRAAAAGATLAPTVREEVAMATLTQSLRKEHAELLEDVAQLRLSARELPELSPGERTLLLARILDFLQGTLVPHAALEEREIYPRVARILGHDDATAPMLYDHLAIRERIADLAATPVEETERLQELLYSLHVLIRTHFWKEEDLYLPLLRE